MKIHALILILMLLLIPTRAAYTSPVQPVADAANLVQNIEQTLRTIRIEHKALVAISQRAEAIGQRAQTIINLQNQLMIAKRNLENIAILIKTGQYKSINELNALCFAVQRIGYSVTNIETAFELLFPDYFKNNSHSLVINQQQIKELNAIIKGAMTVEAEAIRQNNINAANITEIIHKSVESPGIKGAIQANTAMLAEIASQNMEIKKLLAMISRVNATSKAKELSDEQKALHDHTRFMQSFHREQKGFLTPTLQRFTKIISFGYTSLVPEAMNLLQYFIILEIFFFGVMMMFTRHPISYDAIIKIMVIGFYDWLIPNIELVSTLIMRTFAVAGVIAGQNAMTVEELFNPSEITMIGFDICIPIFDVAGKWTNPFDMILLGLTGVVIIVSYCYVAWVLFLAIIEFYLVTVVAVWTMPFALFKRLNFIAERTIAAAFALGIRFMFNALALCGGKLLMKDMVDSFNKLKDQKNALVGEASGGFLETVKDPEIIKTLDLTIQQSLDLMLAAVTIAIIFLGANRMASTFFGGAPSLGGSALVGAIRTATRTVQNSGKGLSDSIEKMIAATSKHKKVTA